MTRQVWNKMCDGLEWDSNSKMNRCHDCMRYLNEPSFVSFDIVHMYDFDVKKQADGEEEILNDEMNYM